MKKIFAILALAVSGTAFAADYVSVDVENVLGNTSAGNGTAQYIRAGKEIGGIQFGLQGRTATMKNNSGMWSSLEVTAAKNSVKVLGITPFVGAALIFLAITIPLTRLTDWLLTRERDRTGASKVR